MLSNKGSQSKLVGTEKFWRGHYEAQKLSQLSRKAYCKQNGISYSQFSYWAGKWNQNHVGKLIPVGVKGKINSKSEETLCTLELKNGHCLKIHNSKVLDIILERYR
jgi:hypothetical protein